MSDKEIGSRDLNVLADEFARRPARSINCTR